MFTLIVMAIGAAASIASSAINARTQQKIAAAQSEIEALKLEEAEIGLEVERQKTLQAVIQDKAQTLALLLNEESAAANRNTIVTVSVLFLAGYVSFLVLRPQTANVPKKQTSGAIFVGLMLAGVALLGWVFVKQKGVELIKNKTV